MSYLVLARKWRPMSFRDLVGQDHVSRTLASAIENGRVAHAFLFTGVRGVGKTTSARILAKALNCMGKPGSEKEATGPTVEPCLECAACKEIALGTDMDVREIDGASYNGVDEVRKLQDSLPYRPTRDRYKIVIVDEVHMLSNAAWNAFLKTLEEPPPHVKFIFATTEVHKVPVTILSRVQRFDFKLIPARTVAQRLRYVLEQEDVSFDEAAIAILAQKAAGSMRDGMSLLDQVIAFGGKELRGEDVARVLGVASRRVLLDVCRALLEGDGPATLSIVQGAAEQGLDMVQLARDLLGSLRDLVVARIAPSPAALLDLPDDERETVTKLAQSGSEQDLLRLHQGFSKGFDDISRGSDPRSNLEMLLLRLALRPPLLPIDQILERLLGLERRLATPRGTHADQPPPRGAAGPPQAAVRPPQAPPSSPPNSRGQSPSRARAPRSDAAPAARAETAASEEEPDPAPPSALPGALAPKSPAHGPDSQPEREAAAPESVPAVPEEILLRARPILLLCDELRGEDEELAAYVEQGEVEPSGAELLRLRIEPGFLFEKKLMAAEALGKIQAILDRHDPARRLELSRGPVEYSLSRIRAYLRQVERQELMDELANHPRVQQAIELLGAKIRSVVLPD